MLIVSMLNCLLYHGNYTIFIYFQHLTFLQTASCATLLEFFRIKMTAESSMIVIELGKMPFITSALPTLLFITLRTRHVLALVEVWFITILLFLRIIYIIKNWVSGKCSSIVLLCLASCVMSHSFLPCSKKSKRTLDSLGRLYFYFSTVFYILEAFLVEQLFHSRLLDARWL